MEQGLGTHLRHLIFLLDSDVEAHYRRLRGLERFRPRYTPVVRCLLELGPVPIRALADHIGLTHSAMSQTVSQMAREGWVTIRPDKDGRSKIVAPSLKLREELPVLEQQWEATARAAEGLERDIGAPLSEVVKAAIAALEDVPFASRIEAAIDASEVRK